MSRVSFKLFAGLVAAVVLTVVAPVRAEPPPLAHERLNVANGCFIESVALLDDLAVARGSDSWARLLHWGAKKDDEDVTGHAVAVCQAGDALWCWDVNFGWKKLATPLAQRDTVEAVSPAITARYPDISPTYPEFLEEFAQEADPGSTPQVFQSENGDARDVSVAAIALARHRPVNAVEFVYGLDGASTPAAAVIFEYNGRMFVYTPTKGTFASRARGSIHNVRVVGEMLRRLFPGARNVSGLAAS